MLHQVPPHCHSCKVLAGHCAQARSKLQPVWANQPQESLQEDQDQDVERCGVVMLPALLTTTCRFIAVPISATEQYLISSSGQTYLTEKLQIWMLPTLALIRKEKVIDYICGFDDFGGKDDFKTEVLACRLANQAMIEYEGGDEDYGAVQQSAPQEQRSVRTSNWRAMQRTESDEDSDFSD